jgi:hypothetical protein
MQDGWTGYAPGVREAKIKMRIMGCSSNRMGKVEREVIPTQFKAQC